MASDIPVCAVMPGGISFVAQSDAALGGWALGHFEGARVYVLASALRLDDENRWFFVRHARCRIELAVDRLAAMLRAHGRPGRHGWAGTSSMPRRDARAAATVEVRFEERPQHGAPSRRARHRDVGRRPGRGSSAAAAGIARTPRTRGGHARRDSISAMIAACASGGRRSMAGKTRRSSSCRCASSSVARARSSAAQRLAIPACLRRARHQWTRQRLEHAFVLAVSLGHELERFGRAQTRLDALFLIRQMQRQGDREVAVHPRGGLGDLARGRRCLVRDLARQRQHRPDPHVAIAQLPDYTGVPFRLFARFRPVRSCSSI